MAGSEVLSLRHPCERLTVERQGSESVASAQATACGLLGSAPVERVQRARHMVSTT